MLKTIKILGGLILELTKANDDGCNHNFYSKGLSLVLQ